MCRFSAGGECGKDEGVKILQILMAFAGGSLAIYGELENGYAVGFVALMSAWFGTLFLTRSADLWRYAKKRNDRLLGGGKPPAL
jgi:hypothetical protein